MYNNHLFTLRSFANIEESHYQTSLKKKKKKHFGKCPIFPYESDNKDIYRGKRTKRNVTVFPMTTLTAT